MILILFLSGCASSDSPLATTDVDIHIRQAKTSATRPEHTREIIVQMRQNLKQFTLQTTQSSPWLSSALDQDHTDNKAFKGPQIQTSSKAKRYGLDRFHVITVPAGEDYEQTLAQLQTDPNIETAEPNYIYRTMAKTDDTYFNSQGSWGQNFRDLWGIHAMEVPAAWDRVQGEGIIVAVIDTGLDINHEDVPNLWTNEAELNGTPGVDDDGNGLVDDLHGYDFVENDPDISDGNGHGTHVAGTVAAHGNNNIGIVGVAFKAQVMSIKGLSDTGQGNSNALANAIVYAADMGAHIINMSWGGNGSNAIVAQAIDYAVSKGVLPIAAAGNSNQQVSGFSPAGLANVLAVAAITPDEEKASFSNHGNGISVTAPGTSILSLLSADSSSLGPVLGQKYTYIAGTSMAAPHVAGLAALIWSRDLTLSAQNIWDIIEDTADDIGEPDYDTFYGYGKANALTATEFVVEMTNKKPSIEPIEKISIKQGVEQSLRFFVSDPDGDPIEIQIANLSPNASIDQENQTLSWKPGSDEVGNHLLTVEISDGFESISKDFEVLVVGKDYQFVQSNLSLTGCQSSSSDYSFIILLLVFLYIAFQRKPVLILKKIRREKKLRFDL